jgi:hypothetical protein
MAIILLILKFAATVPIQYRGYIFASI